MKQVMEKEELQEFLSDNVKDAWNTTCKAESKYREEYKKKNQICYKEDEATAYRTHTHVLHIHTMRTRFGQSCCGTLAKVGPTGAAEHIYILS